MMLDICNAFCINDAEYKELYDAFGKLCWHAAHDLKKKNTRNNYIDDVEDINQNLTIDLMRAGSYTKRQIYIEKCLELANKYAKDLTIITIIKELENLWSNRTRHGANRQKFGPTQENILDKIVLSVVPEKERPNKQDKLKIDSKFFSYCKTIIWNGQKSMGRKITRERSIRNGMVSLSEFDYLGSR